MPSKTYYIYAGCYMPQQQQQVTKVFKHFTCMRFEVSPFTLFQTFKYTLPEGKIRVYLRH